MTFLDGARLWLLLLVVGLAVAYVVVQRRRRTYAVRFTNLDLLDQVAPKKPGWRRHAAALGLLLALSTMVLAFARPTHKTQVPRERATVILALDVSLSMKATDVSPTRLDALKQAATTFVDQLPPKINLGVVSFSGRASLAVPPTTDRDQAKKAIQNLELGEGTAIGDAILASLDAIKQVGSDTSSTDPIPARIVLMSDGKTTVGHPDADGVDAAKQADVPVSTIAFGTDHGSITVPDVAEPVPVPVDSEALQAIADGTGGTFFEATTEGELAQVYQDIGSSIGFDTKHTDISEWFVGAALLALLATAAMSLTWFSRLP